MARAVVLGSGMVGSLIAADLAQDDSIDVTVYDASEASLERAKRCAGDGVKLKKADLSTEAAILSAIDGADVVVGALASHLGYRALQAVVGTGGSYVDISFMPENAMDLLPKARHTGAVCVVDCGVAPGMSNLLAGEAARVMDVCQSIEIYVGGLPVLRRWPFEYKAGFAPADVIEEYTRPSRIVEHGEVVVREALSEPELMDFDGVGTLEAFNTDGLRSLAETLTVPFMKEKTLRYEGHIELMRVFRDVGLFGQDEIDVNGVKVRPLDVISTLMFPKWTYEEGEADLTVMRIIARGELQRKQIEMRWDLLDFLNPETGDTSMSRTTGFPAAIIARVLLEKKIDQVGVVPPERIASEWLTQHLIDENAKRGVNYSFTKTPPDGLHLAT